MAELKPSIRATYDSRETGPRYWITTEVDGKTLAFRTPIDSPFVRINVTVTWWARLRGLFRRQMLVTCVIGADTELMNDVLELDEDQLVPGRTRRAAFQQKIGQRLGEVRRG